jgi:hypothetical protein
MLKGTELNNTRSVLSVGILVATLMVSACSEAGSDGGTTTTADGTTTTADGTTTTAAAEQPIDDGTWFAFVTVGEDETGEMTLGVDLADMLTGEEARAAAVEDGFISEGEDVPNDFYIDNDEQNLELLHVADGAQFGLIPASDTSEKVLVDPPILAEVYEGTYSGDPFYGIPPGTPIAMEVTISEGLVSGGEAVYLP